MGLAGVGDVMASFTDVTSWSKGGQDKTGAEEIVTAYKEHREVLKQSIAGIELPTNAQSKALWVGIQTWLETYCTEFIDHVNGPLNTAKDDLLYFTLDSWQKAAGLNESATASETWRRKSDPTAGFSYGRIQNGDLRQGAWVFEDLQKGLGILKHTVLDKAEGPEWYGDQINFHYRVSGNYIDPEPVIAAWNDNMSEWGPFAGNVYVVVARSHKPGGGNYIEARRDNYIPVLYGLPAIPRVVKHYAKGAGAGGYLFDDYDGIGLIEGEYVLLSTAASSTDEDQILDIYTDISTCPILPEHTTDKDINLSATTTDKFLAEWDFSYE